MSIRSIICGLAAVVCATAAQSAGLSSLPLSFETVPQSTAYSARGASAGIVVDANGARIESGDKRVELRFEGARSGRQPEALEKLGGVVNYLIGSDPRRWRTGVPIYAKVKYRQIYAGVDVIYYGNENRLEYDFVLAPGARPDAIRLRLYGASKPEIAANGDLIAGIVRQPRPFAYQDVDGRRVEVESKYTLKPGGGIGVDVGRYNPALPLVIDPVLTYASYLGGTVNDGVASVKVDAAGNLYVAGFTSSSAFISGGAQPTYGGNNSTTRQMRMGDAFVAKLSPAGNALIYATYLGGAGEDFASSLAIDGEGAAYVVGGTQSSNFPVSANAPQKTYRGFSDDNFFYNPGDGFVAKLNPAGSQIVYATYLGGTLNDMPMGVAVDSSGNAVVVGSTNSSDFPTTADALFGQFRGRNNRAPNGGPSTAGDGFITVLNPAGAAFTYSTYFGGAGRDGIAGVALDPAGAIYVCGITLSSDFPVSAGAAQATFKSVSSNVNGTTFTPGDGFVSKLSPQRTLAYSTFLGGAKMDAAMAIAVDATGAAYVTGGTQSTDFPVTAGAAQSAYGGSGSTGTIGAAYGGDAFVTKVNPGGTAFAYSTYLGGSGDEAGMGIGVDARGNALLTGFTISPNFPKSSDALQATNAGFGGQGLSPAPDFGITTERVRNTGDAFLTRLTPAGTVDYSSFYGGARDDMGLALAVDAAGNAYIGGLTLSPALAGAASGLQTAFGGATDIFPRGDGFVAKFDFGGKLPGPAARVSAVAGFSGSGAPGAVLATPFIVEVLDSNGTPVSGVEVAFTATNATVNPASARTAANGRAQTTVTLGAAGGSGSVTATVAGIPTATAALTINAASTGPVVRAAVNGASFTDSLAPGSWMTVYTDVTADALVQAGTLPLPTTLGGFRVLVNGRATPIVAVVPLSPGTQINAQLPSELTPGTAQVVVERNGTASAAFPITVQATAPGIFVFGANRAVVQNIHPDNSVSVNTADNPIPAGGFIIAYLTGQGPLDNPLATGALAGASPLSLPTQPYSATLNGRPVEVLFLGMTPGQIALAQANIRVPADMPAGTWPLVIRIGGADSNGPLVTVSAPRP